MNMLRSRVGRPIIGLVALFAVELALVAFLRASGRHIGLPFSLLLSLVMAVPAVWLACLYWRRIDEAARAAQKTAWFWGGILGMAAGFVALGIYVRLGLAPTDLKPGLLLTYGAGVIIAAQLIGFHIAWAYWWWKRR